MDKRKLRENDAKSPQAAPGLKNEQLPYGSCFKSGPRGA